MIKKGVKEIDQNIPRVSPTIFPMISSIIFPTTSSTISTIILIVHKG